MTASSKGTVTNLFCTIVSSQRILHGTILHGTNLKCMLSLDEPRCVALPVDAKQEE